MSNATTTTGLPVQQQQLIHPQFLHVLYYFVGAVLAFFMQVGFFCIESGFVDEIWQTSIMIKNIEDTFASTVSFIFVGYSIAYSKSLGGVMGDLKDTLLIETPKSTLTFVLFQTAFCIACCTILSGAVVERLRNKAYTMWVVWVGAVQYPLIAHWIWNENGWLKQLGFVDYSGAVVVHVTGGVSSLVALWWLGSRSNSWDPNASQLKHVGQPRHLGTYTMGALFLWFGWFGMNSMSTDYPRNNFVTNPDQIATAAINTLITPAVSACTSIMFMYITKKNSVNVFVVLNTAICGMVVSTAGAGIMPPWASFVTGMLTPGVYYASKVYVRYNKIRPIDDPLSVVSVHASCGVFGALMNILFVNDTLMITGNGSLNVSPKGVLFGGGVRIFWVQIVGILVVILTNVILTLFIFVFLDYVVYAKSPLYDTLQEFYLGSKIYKISPGLALKTMMSMDVPGSYYLLKKFHDYTVVRQCSDQLDFLLSVGEHRQKCEKTMYLKASRVSTADMRQSAINLRDTYFRNGDGMKSLQISQALNSVMEEMEIDANTTSELVFTMFDSLYDEVFRLMLPIFRDFMLRLKRNDLPANENNNMGPVVNKAPYHICADYTLIWDEIDEETQRKRHTSIKKIQARYNREAERVDVDGNGMSHTSFVNNRLTAVQPGSMRHSYAVVNGRNGLTGGQKKMMGAMETAGPNQRYSKQMSMSGSISKYDDDDEKKGGERRILSDG